MAIDARHHNLFLPQLTPNRELCYPNQGNGQMGGGGGALGVVPLVTTMEDRHGVVVPCQQYSLQPKTSMNTDSGLTCNVPPPPRKRSRDCFDSTNSLSKNNTTFSPYPFGADIGSQLQQYQFDLDDIISQHTKKMRAEIEEWQKQEARLIVQAVGESLVKKMNEKDEQIKKIVKFNMILQERVKSLYVENQLWRDLAQTNEATANTLRSNLEQVLAHVTDERFPGGGREVEEDAQSCCGSSNGEEEEEYLEVDGQAQAERRTLANRMCRGCGERESCVLLLPCRHLCLCTLCGSSLIQNCPVCNSNMNATVHVNMSSS